MEKRGKSYDIFDLAKIIMSLMVMAIHVGIFPEVLYPWLRIAVPLFFMISGYLLFSKINASPKKERSAILKKSIKRQLSLYVLWTLILLWPTIIYRAELFEDGVFGGIILFIRRFLITGSFPASWFIIANIWAIPIVVWLSDRVEKSIVWRRAMPFLLCAIYLFCCVFSTYGIFFSVDGKVWHLKQMYENILFSPVFSFPIAVFWVYLGKMFADKKKQVMKKGRKVFIVWSIVSAVLLYVEWRLMYLRSNDMAWDLYLGLVPLAIGLFGLMLHTDIKLRSPKLWRELSVVIFTTHTLIKWKIDAYMVESGLVLGWAHKPALFIITLALCVGVYFLIKWLEQRRYFAFLKYLH